MAKRIAVLTSGGDAPGMNAGIRAIVRTALANDWEVYGCRNGFRGLVENDLFVLEQSLVANIIQRGGTILKTDRYPEFKQATIRRQAIENLREHGIEALIVLGGDGSFRGAKVLGNEGGIKTIGIPCTIDNDIVGTDYTIGFDTAGNTALKAIDNIRDTAFSHNNNFLVEVMGRSSGFLAMHVGIAGGAEFILVPELDLSVDDLISRIRERQRLKLGSIIVIAEADQPGRSFYMAEKINAELDINYKVCVLGHTQRGGAPTMHDREIASLMGYRAVKALLDNKDQVMVAYKKEHFTLVEFPELETGSRRLGKTQLFHINDVLCHL